MEEFINKKVRSLPPLSETAIQILKICNDPEASLKELTTVVEKDPMLTASILKSANSPLYGFSREISSISRAVSLFGMTTIKGFALNAAVKNSIKVDLTAYKMSESKFSTLSSKQNTLAINWLNKADEDIKKTVIPASFLLEIGKIIISSALKEKGDTNTFTEGLANIKSPFELAEYEKAQIGMSSNEVSAMVFDKWNLEVDMIDAISHCITPEIATIDVRKNAIALNIILNLVNIFDVCSEESINTAIELAKANELYDDKLIEAINLFKQND